MTAPAGFERLHARLAAELRTLPDKPEESAESAARALWLLAAGVRVSATAAMARALPELDAQQSATLQTLLGERLRGTPLAHLTGRQRFMGLEMLAGPGALIPRHETELLATAALAKLHAIARTEPHPLVIDVCTGSANVAAALAQGAPTARVLAADLMPEAVELARQNLVLLGLQGRVTLRQGDLLAPFDDATLLGQVDLLTCNPPYISAARREAMAFEISHHEPRAAFDGGPLGISILQRVVRESPRWLKAGGWLALEVGAGQGLAVQRRLRAGAFDLVETACDAAGEVRALLARRRPDTR